MVTSFWYRLRLPDDSIRRRQLSIKMRQYEERAATIEYQLELDPENLGLRFDLKYLNFRLAILHHLLLDGEVELGTLQRELRVRGLYSRDDWECWVMACLVIIDYTINGGLHVINGTGLPEVKRHH